MAVSAFSEGVHDTGVVRLHYVEAGSGPLLVFHHGFPSFWMAFHHQLAALAGEFHVVAVDGLGANTSSKPDDLSLYRVEHLVSHVDSLARSLGGDEPFTLIGHDWGGALAWTFAQALPHRLDKVVVLNAPPTNQLLHLIEHDNEQRSRSSYMYAMREPGTFERLTEPGRDRLWRFAYPPLLRFSDFTAEVSEQFRLALAVPGAAAGGINWYRANIPPVDEITDADFWPSRDASTDVPALLIWGEDDGTFVPEFIDGLPAYASDLTVQRLPDTGHWPMLERPGLVTELIRDFVTDR